MASGIIYEVVKYTTLDAHTREVRTVRRFKNRDRADELAYELNEKSKDNEFFHVESFCE